MRLCDCPHTNLFFRFIVVASKMTIQLRRAVATRKCLVVANFYHWLLSSVSIGYKTDENTKKDTRTGAEKNVLE